MLTIARFVSKWRIEKSPVPSIKNYIYKVITLFRNIRKSLLGSGQAHRYIFYALGEIALVVIGILIALQINNWNEWRKERKLEKEILEDVLNDLERNRVNLASLIAINKENNRSADRIISFIQNKHYSIDSLPVHLHRARFSAAYGLFLSTAGYESLKDSGFNIVKNDILKDMILNLYEIIYPKTTNFVEIAIHHVFIDGNRLIDQHFVTDDGGLLNPLNFEETLNDVSYYIFLKRARGLRNAMINRTRKDLTETTNVIQLISNELIELN